MEKINRHLMPSQEPEVRRNNFKEVALGYTDEIAYAEAQRCLNCKNPQCVQGCPVNVNIPGFISKIKEKDLDGAATILEQDNNLAAICGRVCPQERQCESLCIRGKLEGPVAIGNLERYVADYALNNITSNIKTDEFKDRKVAVIGSGPASLTCAANLAMKGVKVTVYEALHKAGGVLVYGIPEFRLPKDLVQKVIDRVTALGVDIKLNVVVGKSIYIDELLEENDAVFIGTGAGLPQFLRCEGENLAGVYSANEYLTRVNLMKAYDKSSITPVKRGKKVVVVGAGNVAMDAARTAVRLGGEVHLVYRRSRQEMPARAEEIHHAEEEGVIFDILTNPIRIFGENGNVTGMTCVKMELGEPDASGRRSPIPVEGSEFDIQADQVIVALGTSPNPIIKNSYPALKFTPKGTIEADAETGETNIKNLYAGGDAQTGAATVILAMGAGKRAAKAMLDSFTK